MPFSVMNPVSVPVETMALPIMAGPAPATPGTRLSRSTSAW